jgi:hypothetical protein
MHTQVATAFQYHITGFSLSTIVFDDSQYATLWVKCRINNKLQNAHLIISVSNLNDVLRFNPTPGENVLLQMANELLHNNQQPYIVDVNKLLGAEAVFTNCALSVSEIETNELATASPEPCFWVHQVQALSIIQQAKNLVIHSKDFNITPQIQYNKNSLHITELKQRYQFYLGLLELDINEDSARERAELADNRLYTLAKYSHEPHQVSKHLGE